jgi:hypothetical protein
MGASGEMNFLTVKGPALVSFKEPGFFFLRSGVPIWDNLFILHRYGLQSTYTSYQQPLGPGRC